MGKGVEEIDFFVVTSDSGSSLEELHLKKRDFLDLPQRASVVEVGSGREQGLARRLRKIRPDLKITIVDPTLSFKPDREDVAVSIDPEYTNYYFSGRVKLPLPVETIQEFRRHQQLRLSNLPEKVAVSTTLAPRLDMPNHSVHMLLDCRGPGIYLKEKQFSDYLQSISRVLIRGYAARVILTTVGWIDRFISNGDNTQKCHTKVSKVIIEKLAQIPNLEMDHNNYFWEDDAFGLVLRKT